MGRLMKSYISQRPAKQAAARVRRLSNKNLRRKKQKKYSRHAKVGVRRPKMRRQIGLTRVSRSK
jgi:hypothetical protein